MTARCRSGVVAAIAVAGVLLLFHDRLTAGGWPLLARTNAQDSVAFVTIAQGSDSQMPVARHIVVRSAAEWPVAWRAHSVRPVPEVDFARFIVAGVMVGPRPTAGYRVEIVAARVEDGHVVVEYTERRPAPDTVVAQVLTSPFHFIRLPREVGTVRFIEAEQR